MPAPAKDLDRAGCVVRQARHEENLFATKISLILSLSKDAMAVPPCP
jgi:hypothetical protein